MHCAFLDFVLLTRLLFLQDSINQLGRSSDYLDYDAVRDSILKEGNNSDIDWVRPVVDRLNLSVFTNAVWSDKEKYGEAIYAYFSLLVPKQLHDRDDVIDMFLNMVTRRQILKAPWPTDQHEIQGVVNNMKEEIEEDLEDEDQWLCQRVLDAFNKKYEHVCCYDTGPNGMFFIILLVRWIRCQGRIWITWPNPNA